MAAHTATVINPAAMPSGTELFFGYSNSIHAVFTDLIYTTSYTCSSNPQSRLVQEFSESMSRASTVESRVWRAPP